MGHLSGRVVLGPRFMSVSVKEGRPRWPIRLAWLLLASAVLAALAAATNERGLVDWLLVGGQFVLAAFASWFSLRERAKTR
jgi:hypothetical protein